MTRTEFNEKYPNHCRKCNGSGLIYHYFDPSPAGVHIGIGGMMEDADACPDCFEKGLCPMCGEKLPEDYSGWSSCPACGWDEATTQEAPDYTLEELKCLAGEILSHPILVEHKDYLVGSGSYDSLMWVVSAGVDELLSRVNLAKAAGIALDAILEAV